MLSMVLDFTFKGKQIQNRTKAIKNDDQIAKCMVPNTLTHQLKCYSTSLKLSSLLKQTSTHTKPDIAL